MQYIQQLFQRQALPIYVYLYAFTVWFHRDFFFFDLCVCVCKAVSVCVSMLFRCVHIGIGVFFSFFFFRYFQRYDTIRHDVATETAIGVSGNANNMKIPLGKFRFILGVCGYYLFRITEEISVNL